MWEYVVNFICNSVTQILPPYCPVIVSLVSLDSLYVALQFMYRKIKSNFTCSAVNGSLLVESYGDIYDVQHWTTRYIHYVIVGGLLYIVPDPINQYCSGVIVILHFPPLFNTWCELAWPSTYFYTIQTEQEYLVRFAMLVGVTHLIKPHIQDPLIKSKLSAVRMFSSVDSTRLRLMSKNLAVIYLLAYLRSYAHLYIYYKIAKYIYYYNYGYKFEVMSIDTARNNLYHIIDNNVWHALSEPIFIHSILTLESHRNVSRQRYHDFLLTFYLWLSLWTIGTVFQSIQLLVCLYLVISTLKPRSVFAATLGLACYKLVDSWVLCSFVLSTTHVLFNKRILDFIMQFATLHKQMTNEDFIKVPLIDLTETDGFLVVN